MLKTGIDIGSTTVKIVATDNSGKILFSRYRRHNANAKEVVANLMTEMKDHCGDIEADIKMTGSVGMGFSEKYGLPFVQEVVAATKAVQSLYPGTATLIDIGGEDAKVVFFSNGRATDLRMNGNCAGGTGAFIDQMAVLLNVSVDELDRLASNSARTYPIASRCGVFCKTDIQNLIARNVSRADIAASIFHAVAVQTVVTLAHGCKIEPPVLVCGGPLTFIPSLRTAFKNYLSLTDDEFILPENGNLLPALGAAMTNNGSSQPRRLSDIIAELGKTNNQESTLSRKLRPIFSNEKEHDEWLQRMDGHNIPSLQTTAGSTLPDNWPTHDDRQATEVYIGIDSGSTTTKIVVTDTRLNIIYSYYNTNNGDPVKTVEEGLSKLKEQCDKRGINMRVAGSCSTGYGEDLIKAAFQMNAGIVETIAHYTAARHLDPDVSFILDIGGQDMKAIFVNNGIIDRIEINEACSSGCGSFIETFAKTLGHTAHEFAEAACRSTTPLRPGHTLHGVHELESEAGTARRRRHQRHCRRTGLFRSEKLPVQGTQAEGRLTTGRPHRRTGRHDAQRRRCARPRTADMHRSDTLRHA